MAVTDAQARAITTAFAHIYPGALKLAYKFRRDVVELYGPRAHEVPQDAKGGYVCGETVHAGRVYLGQVHVPLQNMDDGNDLILSLRHEVLGHYGINTFTHAEKRALLDGLIHARNEPDMLPLWSAVNQSYMGESLDVRAEEVFALHSQSIEPGQHIQTADQARRCGQQSFLQTCISRVRPMQGADLGNIALMVAQGLHDQSRGQQVFPQVNEIFRKGDAMHEASKEAQRQLPKRNRGLER